MDKIRFESIFCLIVYKIKLSYEWKQIIQNSSLIKEFKKKIIKKVEFFGLETFQAN